MNNKSIDLTSLPIDTGVANALKEIFASEEVDLRDVVDIAFQDPVVLANIIVLVNKSFQKMDRPVVNTLSAAINLLGIPILSKSILALKSINEFNLSNQRVDMYNLIRNRIYVAAHMTKFWAEYMGERNAEEQYCVSMFTGLVDITQYVLFEQGNRQSTDNSFLDSIESMKMLYPFDGEVIPKLPDSIQQIHMNSSYTRRVSLSVLSYELISAFELGYSSEIFNIKLKRAVDCIDQSLSRATNDFAIQLVELEKKSKYISHSHSKFLLSTDIDTLDPFDEIKKAV